jgi:glutathione synthase/RimK-type ligase-like ATP-grasp enzyme
MDTSLNKKRFFVEAIESAAREQGIETHWMSDDWICELKKGSKTQFVYGFNFPLNTATGWEVAKDKSATSQILTKYGISCVEHKLFIQPELKKYTLVSTNANKVFGYADHLKYPLVCKDNCGAGGNNVFKIHTKEELQKALSSIWKISRGASLCPFYEIEHEYRFFVLDGEIQFVFKKILLGHEWKFNLSKGGGAELVEVGSIPESIKERAIRAASCLGLKICSVDIIKIKNTEEHLVLEVNTAITTEHFARTSLVAKQKSQKLYSDILKKIFE